MEQLTPFRKAFESLGFAPGAIFDDYVFSDVLAVDPRDRTVHLAAFTQTPPSYRNAAMAVIDVGSSDLNAVADYRALGAPLIFSIAGDEVTAWQMRSAAPPRMIVRAALSELAALFDQNRDTWTPLAIHRAKSIGHVAPEYQLDFVDAGLMPAIEGQVHGKLDRAIESVLNDAVTAAGLAPGDRSHRALFQATFRLLAAKILSDRGHEISRRWNPDDIASVLDVISAYYRLPSLAEGPPGLMVGFEQAWRRLRDGLSFRNISADDLAFVYEQTLVTPETRKHFGTHSTPRQVAEHVVASLQLWKHDVEDLRIYEPFTGAGVLLVAALRHVRDLLPVHWSDKAKHQFLVQRLAGDEIDAFAVEVATLSLILADYPNANGWKIGQADLFADDYLAARSKISNVIICNPPFESFTAEERIRYPEAFRRSAAKPIAVLNAVLDAKPLAIGFVLPEPFIRGKQYAAQRRRIEQMYAEVELVSLPDRTFNASVIRSSLLIARALRDPAAEPARTSIRCAVVSERERDAFLSTGQLSVVREQTRPLAGTGDLWIEELADVWSYLQSADTLGEIAAVHRGIEWRSDQAAAVRNHAQPGFVPGIHASGAMRMFATTGAPVWLDARPERLMYKAINLPWSEPKILANAARVSRGPWALAAAIDRTGIVASQQLFGIWRKPGAPSLQALAALLNSPLGSAFISTHSPPDRIRVSAVRAVPIPHIFPVGLDDLVDRYCKAAQSPSDLFTSDSAADLQSLLDEIDGLVMRAFDLPPKLEWAVLAYFHGAQRPTIQPWQSWPAGTLALVPTRFSKAHLSAARAGGSWISDTFRPLPKEEAILLREALDDVEAR
jgi:hypothetical protein